MPLALPPPLSHCDNQKYHQTLSHVPWKANSPLAWSPLLASGSWKAGLWTGSPVLFLFCELAPILVLMKKTVVREVLLHIYLSFIKCSYHRNGLVMNQRVDHSDFLGCFGAWILLFEITRFSSPKQCACVRTYVYICAHVVWEGLIEKDVCMKTLFPGGLCESAPSFYWVPICLKCWVFSIGNTTLTVSSISGAMLWEFMREPCAGSREKPLRGWLLLPGFWPSEKITSL